MITLIIKTLSNINTIIKILAIRINLISSLGRDIKLDIGQLYYIIRYK